MPRNRGKRGKPGKTVHEIKKYTFLGVLGSRGEVDNFIEYFYGYPGYVATIEEGQIFMERYTKRVVREDRIQYVVHRKSNLGPGQPIRPVV